MAQLPQTKAQPSLTELLSDYLRRRAQNSPATAGDGEVIPFDSAPAAPVDSRLAWQDATAAARHYVAAANLNLEMTPEWSTLVSSHEPVAALPLCFGNFPQLVRDLHGLLHAQELSALRPAPARPVDAGALEAM